MGENLGGLGLFRGGFIGAQAHARLRHQGLRPRSTGHRQNPQVHWLGVSVLVGDYVIVVEDGGAGAHAGKHLAGHDLGVGVEVRDDDVTLHQRPGKLQPAFLQRQVFKIIPAVLGIEIFGAMLHGVQLDRTQGIIQRAEGQAGKLIIFGGCRIEALPCGKIFFGDAGGCRKAVKAGAGHHQHVGGFGNREDEQAAILHTVLQKAGDKFRQLLRREGIVPVQNILLTQGKRISDMAGENIREGQGIRVIALRIKQELADFCCTGHIHHANQNPCFAAGGAVEFVHQFVHRGASLLAVDMPHDELGGILGIQQGFFTAGCQTPHESQRRQYSQEFFCHFLSFPLQKQLFEKFILPEPTLLAIWGRDSFAKTCYT